MLARWEMESKFGLTFLYFCPHLSLLQTGSLVAFRASAPLLGVRPAGLPLGAEEQPHVPGQRLRKNTEEAAMTT